MVGASNPRSRPLGGYATSEGWTSRQRTADARCVGKAGFRNEAAGLTLRGCSIARRGPRRCGVLTAQRGGRDLTPAPWFGAG